jgi:hypothetical protein
LKVPFKVGWVSVADQSSKKLIEVYVRRVTHQPVVGPALIYAVDRVGGLRPAA